MSKDAKKPEDEMPALPKTFLDQFRCCKCTKYLRPPIRTVCKNGHKVCDICFTALATPTSYCPVSPGCMRSSENITDFAIGNMIKSLKLPMSCKNHAAGCDFSGSLEDVIAHEEDCPYRSVKCVVLSCYQDISFNDLEDHMAREHPKMATGDWEIIRPEEAGAGAGVLALANRYTCPCGYSGPPPGQMAASTYCGYYGQHKYTVVKKNVVIGVYAMRSWRHGGTRFFATLFTGTNSFWQLWVTAACGKTAAEKFRAEIRLSSNLTSIMQQCNNVYYRPVFHFESPILNETTSIDGYAACLQVHQKIVGKHINGMETIADLPAATAIPFNVNVYEKVFLNPDKADIEEKDESDGVPE